MNNNAKRQAMNIDLDSSNQRLMAKMGKIAAKTQAKETIASGIVGGINRLAGPSMAAYSQPRSSTPSTGTWGQTRWSY